RPQGCDRGRQSPARRGEGAPMAGQGRDRDGHGPGTAPARRGHRDALGVTAEPPRHLAVARLRKPHGLKGEITVFPLTGDPDGVFGSGRSLWVVDLAGMVVGGPLVVERSRAYHREWLLKFRGIDSRDALEPWRGSFLGVPADELQPLEPGEVYLHELEGFAVQLEDGTAVGLV